MKAGGLVMLFSFHCDYVARKVQNLHSQLKPQVALTCSHNKSYVLLAGADLSGSVLSTLVVGPF